MTPLEEVQALFPAAFEDRYDGSIAVSVGIVFYRTSGDNARWRCHLIPGDHRDDGVSGGEGTTAKEALQQARFALEQQVVAGAGLLRTAACALERTCS